ncbi:dipicolinate synthase subunit B [Sedimentibacter sp.]|uniref:dipicolinate synthase subunit B n=1 Tax=Sedimentibacter sp. TaxID=1960295 RepID=UPI0028B1F7DC|nr:dipicolinate synthase subunit B [Sedimentibacter sp.]
MILSGKNIGIGITGSFCTFDKIIPQIAKLKELEANVYTVFSNNAESCDTRFGEAKDFLELVYKLTGTEPITTIVDAEPVGPKNLFDIFIIAPATGNTIAKLANAITDTPVLMAAKANLRNNKPIVISVSTNDALSMNFKNIGELYNIKNVFFVPFGQDNYRSKPNSMIADVDQIIPTVEKALEGKQIQPVIISPQ